jgi:hypothetical protein
MEGNMSKEKAKKATFKDLIAKKIQKEADQFKVTEIYVTSMDATLTFQKPKDNLILDVMDEMGDMQVVSKIVGGYKKLIYHTCNMLHDSELQKELEVVDPFDTIEKLFNLADIMEIGEQLMDLIDMADKVETIKN